MRFSFTTLRPLGLLALSVTALVTATSCQIAEEFDVQVKAVIQLDKEQLAQVDQINFKLVSKPYDPRMKPVTYERGFEPDYFTSQSYDFEWRAKDKLTITLSLMHGKGEQAKEITSLTREITVSEDASKNGMMFSFESGVTKFGDCKVAGDVVALTSGAGGANSPTLLWDADRAQGLLLYSDLGAGNGDLMSVRIGALGQALSAPVLVFASALASSNPTVARVGEGYIATWQEGRTVAEGVSVRLARLDTNGAPLAVSPAITTAGKEARPMIAAKDDRVLLTWMDAEKPSRATVRLAAVDPATLALTQQITPMAGKFPSLAASSLTDGGIALAWVGEDGKATRASVVAPAGSALAIGEQGTLRSGVDATALQLRLFPAGTSWLATWESEEGGEGDSPWIFGSYVGADGKPAGQGVVQEPGTGAANWPVAAWNGNHSMVVYYQYRGFKSQLFATRFDTSGNPMDESDIQLTSVAGEAKYPSLQAITLASQGASEDLYGVAWSDDHTGKQQVYFRTFGCKKK